MYKNINKWKASSNYFGDNMEDYYEIYSRCPNQPELVNDSNFQTLLNEFSEIDQNEDIYFFRSWLTPFESILVHKSRTELLTKIDNRLNDLEGYPVLNEDLYSEMQYNQAIEYAEIIKQDFELDPECDYYKSLNKNSTKNEILDYALENTY